MVDSIDSVITDLPKEVKMFLEIDKNKDELYIGKGCSSSSRPDALDRLMVDIFRDLVINCGSSIPANTYDYINDIIRYEYNHKHYGLKQGIVTVDIIFVPKKIIVGYSGDNGFFKYKETKSKYENKELNNPACKLSDLIFVDTVKDKLYCGKKI